MGESEKQSPTFEHWYCRVREQSESWIRLCESPIPNPQSRLSEKAMKQIQDAYIVAATRTPVGKAPKGVFRNTRPADMLAHILNAVISHAPALAVNRLDAALIGCAIPRGRTGMHVAPIA